MTPGRALRLARAFLLSMLDALGSNRALAPGAPGMRGAFHGGAARRLLGAASRLGLGWGCRRRAMVLYRALRRDGEAACLRFGIRRPAAGERTRTGFVGHVWVARPGRAPGGEGYVAVVSVPGGPAGPGWRRG